MYVGKNNYQNDELTFKLATGNDWWFHAKGMPGSHVIVKAENKELPDSTFEEAGKLAGYYSKGKNADKVEIDYLQKKNCQKTKWCRSRLCRVLHKLFSHDSPGHIRYQAD